MLSRGYVLVAVGEGKCFFFLSVCVYVYVCVCLWIWECGCALGVWMCDSSEASFLHSLSFTLHLLVRVGVCVPLCYCRFHLIR